MATERRLEAIPAQLILSNGDATGRIAVIDASIFKVKQVITLFSDSVSPSEYQIKHVIPGFIYLGRPDKPITEYSKLDQFTLVDETKISAREQPRPTISQPDIQRAVYAEEPTVAIRAHSVDMLGRPYSNENPLPIKTVTATDELSFRFDQVPDGSIMYVAEGKFGALDTEPKWKIKKVEVNLPTIKITNASENFDQIWNNRLGLIYV